MIIAILLAVLNLFTPTNVQAPVSSEAIAPIDDMSWDEWHGIEYANALDQFDAIFNAIEYKVAKNGRSMTKGTNTNSYRFI